MSFSLSASYVEVKARLFANFLVSSFLKMTKENLIKCSHHDWCTRQNNSQITYHKHMINLLVHRKGRDQKFVEIFQVGRVQNQIFFLYLCKVPLPKIKYAKHILLAYKFVKFLQCTFFPHELYILSVTQTLTFPLQWEWIHILS